MPDIATSESNSSETDLVIITKRDRFKLFCKLYRKFLIVVFTPLVLMPVTFIGENNAYKCLYVFIVTSIYWVTDAMHPGIVALFPISVSSLMTNNGFISEIYIRSELLDCLGIYLIITALEQSQLNKRMSCKLLLIFGCSHYRLSFLLFFITMFLSMWVSSTIACGLMMPLVKAILTELEKMGILEMYQTIGKSKQVSVRHGESNLRPTDFTIFYFLGIAYSSSIGAMTSVMGSQANQILKIYSKLFFPTSPKIEFPHFLLLNLPGVLVMETVLYLWMNFYFVGMCQAQNDIALEIGITEEESQYITTLLAVQYKHMGRITFHEGIVGAVVILTVILQTTLSYVYIDNLLLERTHFHLRACSPSIFCAIILFVIPRDLTFLRFFRKLSGENHGPLPQSASKACLSWPLVRQNIDWSVLLIIGGSATLCESFRESQMTDEVEKFLLFMENWPSSAQLFVIVLFFKIFTEFAPSSSVAFCFLPHIAKLGLLSNVNPHYMMMAASLGCSLAFHLPTGSPANAMVAAYVHIPPWKMMKAGVGLSLAAVMVVWITVAAWANAVWVDTYRVPLWAKMNIFSNEH